jgi:hypothetical protein
MSNKKRIFKKQKALRSRKSDAAMWECIRIGLIAVNNAIKLKRERLSASQAAKNNFPSGIIISNEQEKILAGVWRHNSIVHPFDNHTMEKAKNMTDAWTEYLIKSNQRIQNEFPKQLEGMLALVKTSDGGTKSVFAGSRDYVAKQNIK